MTDATRELDFPGIVLEAKSLATHTHEDGSALEKLEALSRVNLFVGANNSGKSLLLRHLAHGWNGDILPGQDYRQTRSAVLQDVLQLRDRLSRFPKQKDFDQIINIPETDNLKNGDRFGGIRPLLEQLRLGQIPNGTSFTRLQEPEAGPVRATAQSALAKIRDFERTPLPGHYYIPSLRGLRPLNGPDDVYAARTQSDYGIQRPAIFTGLDMYVRVRKMLLGDMRARELISDYEKFLSRTFFQGRAVSLIPREQDHNDVLYVKIGSEDERPIYSLGDGIQSIIILTFLPHTVGGIFYIEEPEIHLHPGLQRELMNYYTRAENARFFMTTHSNHLLELTADLDHISIFTIRKNLSGGSGMFALSKASAGDLDTLNLLGVRAASVFLANSTIWVEGITDRWFFRELLQKYQEAEQQGRAAKTEDIHFAFVEYGGGNITHWSFLEKEDRPINVSALCSKLFLIMDHDGEKNPDRVEQLRKRLGEQLQILPCRELENLLPPSVLVNTVMEMCKLKGVALILPSWDEYRNEKIGDYIDGTLLHGIGARKKFAADSGTIKEKRSFWKVALHYFSAVSFSDLQGEVQDIARRLYEFIESQNS